MKTKKKPDQISLKSLLNLRLLSQTEFAELIGQKDSSVSLWCTGKVCPRFKTARLIGDKLNATPEKAWKTFLFTPKRN